MKRRERKTESKRRLLLPIVAFCHRKVSLQYVCHIVSSFLIKHFSSLEMVKYNCCRSSNYSAYCFCIFPRMDFSTKFMMKCCIMRSVNSNWIQVEDFIQSEEQWFRCVLAPLFLSFFGRTLRKKCERYLMRSSI